MKDEKGQALAIALVALAIGALLVSPFLRSVSAHSLAYRTYSSSILQHYSSDAGVEDAIWDLTNGTLAAQLTASGDTTSYSLSEAVNGVVPSISVTRDKVIFASDDFESGGWSGGSGWLSAWTNQGDATIDEGDNPHGGNYHLRLRRDTGYAKRDIDLSGQTSARLQFWAKAKNFGGGDQAQSLISSNGSDWTAVKTWVNGDDDNTYHYYNIDLSSYTLSSQFWIAFQASMSGGGPKLWIDDLMVVRELPGTVSGLPSDNFESDSWSGGSGWLDDWDDQGDADIKNDDNPYEGSYHLRLRRDTGYVKRSADLSGQPGLHLQLWAKVNAFEADDEMYLKVSPDDSNWTTVKTWTDTDDDNTYHFYDIDLSAQSPYSSEFWIAFDSGMDDKKDYFYVDDLNIVSQSIAYEIVSSASDEKTRADIVIDNGSVSINSWQIGKVN